MNETASLVFLVDDFGILLDFQAHGRMPSILSKATRMVNF
jgi:hypothetical protein